jgi:hypothetical protein
MRITALLLIAVTASSARGQAASARVSSDSVLTPVKSATLRAAPDGRQLGVLSDGATMTALAREHGWVRVRVEGWVPEKDVAPGDDASRTSLSAADVRADPKGSRGKSVRWQVQLLALQTADALRKDLAADETYMLARGPGDESAMLYIVVPPTLLETVRAVPALSQIVITARVRNGRSNPVGVPILDLSTIAKK